MIDFIKEIECIHRQLNIEIDGDRQKQLVYQASIESLK